MKKILKKLMVLGMAFAVALSATACMKEETKEPKKIIFGDDGKLYILYEDGSMKSVADVEGLEGMAGEPGKDGEDGKDGVDGEDGKDGVDGVDGVTPTVEINEDGYWVINGEVTEHKAVGSDGASGATPTIEVSDDGYWIINGVKTEYVAVGTPGAPGAPGAPGTPGEPGVTPTIDINEDGYWVINGEVTEFKAVGSDGAPGAPGATPTIEISDDGYWVINGEKTEHKAIGKDGASGEAGLMPNVEISDDGYWIINGVKTEHSAVGDVDISNDGYWIINGEKTSFKAVPEDGTSIERVYIDGEGNLIIILTDKTQYNVGLVTDIYKDEIYLLSYKDTLDAVMTTNSFTTHVYKVNNGVRSLVTEFKYQNGQYYRKNGTRETWYYKSGSNYFYKVNNRSAAYKTESEYNDYVSSMRKGLGIGSSKNSTVPYFIDMVYNNFDLFTTQKSDKFQFNVAAISSGVGYVKDGNLCFEAVVVGDGNYYVEISNIGTTTLTLPQ